MPEHHNRPGVMVVMLELGHKYLLGFHLKFEHVAKCKCTCIRYMLQICKIFILEDITQYNLSVSVSDTYISSLRKNEEIGITWSV